MSLEGVHHEWQLASASGDMANSGLYGTYRWKKIARQQLRIKPLCEQCLKQGRIIPANVADHIDPHKGNETAFWFNPLQSLCFSCHNSHKKKVEHTGYSDRIGLDGWPVDPKHPANKK